MAKVRIDLSEAAEGGAFNPRNVEEGDYKAKIKACEINVSKAGNKQLLFTVEVPEVRGATYPYYCPLEGKGAWKTRNIIEAIGKKPPRAAASVDTDIFIGKPIGIELVDDEYEGRMKSVINQVFPASDVNKEADAVDDDDEDEDEAPPAKKTTTRKKPAPVVEEDDEDEDEDEEEEPPARTRKPAAKRRTPEPEPEDDEEDEDLDEDEEEEPAPRRRPAAKKAAPAKRTPARTKRKPAPVDDDDEDLDELDIEEL